MTASALLLSGEISQITPATAAMLLVMFLPFLVSLAGQPGTPKMLCLLSSTMALLLSVEPYRAELPWCLGMAIAVISVREKFRQRALKP
jgi:hypothetical protein